ncbi:hypothetical protein C8J55DRAFT_554864 [Lentinula edodes]|uniref:F-box domain-containing protein n=1 Tax=Lentinula lateritia TaxID=40482 RepID=A0A9W9AZ39_9AGAR|nr:hypothetical protein C8J55DRAFT_554864 [Lentinula edodes]
MTYPGPDVRNSISIDTQLLPRLQCFQYMPPKSRDVNGNIMVDMIVSRSRGSLTGAAALRSIISPTLCSILKILHMAALTLIHGLPNETLSEIFHRYTEMHFTFTTDPDDKSSGWTSLKLGHICSCWRNVAIATQDVWSYIRIPNYVPEDEWENWDWEDKAEDILPLIKLS